MIVVLPLCNTSKCFSEDKENNISSDWQNECKVTDSGNSKTRKLLSGVGTCSNDVYQPA